MTSNVNKIRNKHNKKMISRKFSLFVNNYLIKYDFFFFFYFKSLMEINLKFIYIKYYHCLSKGLGTKKELAF